MTVPGARVPVRPGSGMMIDSLGAASARPLVPASVDVVPQGSP